MVTAPEAGIPEAVDGAVVTGLNEEAVACAALANKGGIDIIVSYEAFGAKMHGAVRQEIVFADHLGRAGRPGWLSIPLVLTSHTWENAKNEQSHQDRTMAEARRARLGHRWKRDPAASPQVGRCGPTLSQRSLRHPGSDAGTCWLWASARASLERCYVVAGVHVISFSRLGGGPNFASSCP